ncbi:MAG: flagellar protein [Caldithrix sp.]|nr:MAG: flagellar protein [Caldithrix sp.]
MEIKHLQNSIPVQPALPNSGVRQVAETGRTAFADVLKSKLSGQAPAVKFSAHASDRLASRNIVLTQHHISKLNQAVQTMAEKGGKEGLVVMDNLAMIVNIKNRTVITAVEKSPLEMGKVFTNIDSALII